MMQAFAVMLFWFPFAMILYVWIIYPALLWLVGLVRRHNKILCKMDQKIPNTVAVVVSAYNEEELIAERIHNIFGCVNSNINVNVIIVSDGSTDNTAKVVRAMSEENPNIRLIEQLPQQGRASAHNLAMSEVLDEVVIFTDAETEFQNGFIDRILSPFSDPVAGFVSGALSFRNINETHVSANVGLYWKYELMLRRLETRIGLYMFGTGACCAVRTCLYKEIPAWGDVDFITPLDVVLQGYKCIHADGAVAYDSASTTASVELASRVRMTAKNWYGTAYRWFCDDWYKHITYTWVLVSHKFLRWLNPYFMMLIFVSNALIINQGPIYMSSMLLQLCFYCLAVFGAVGINVPFSKAAFGFVIANVGFMKGVYKAAMGDVPTKYIPMRHL